MADPITIFKGTTGLNTVNDPARLPEGDVAEIVNLRIDQSGRPSKRPNFELLTAGNFHSLFKAGNNCFVSQTRTSDDAIMQINSDNSLTGIASGLTKNRRMSWCANADLIYFSNSIQSGSIQESVASDWTVGEYFGAATNRDFVIPEYITHMETHSGRMYVSVGNILYWSEQHRFDLFDISGAEFHGSWAQFSGTIRMIKSVLGGLFIGTDEGTYFLTGNNPAAFNLLRIADFPVIEHSDSIEYVMGQDLGYEPGLCALWASTEGAILGLPTGNIINLNKEKIIYSENVTNGFGCLVGYEFIHKTSVILNTNLKAKNATTQYTGIDLTSMVKAHGKYFASTPTGLYLMSSGDESVAAYFVTATMDFGSGSNKRLRYVYLSLESDDDLQLIINTEKVSAITYSITITTSGQQDIRIPINRSLYGRFWTFKVSNGSSGADFSVDEIKVLPIILTRGRGDN